MSSTSTTWTTDTNTKSGTVQVYEQSVSTLRITAGEDTSAILELFADEGDDNADKWRMWVNSADNDLHFTSYTSGAWVDKLTIQDGGNIGIGTSSPNYKLEVENTTANNGGTLSLSCSETTVVDTNVIGQVLFRGRDTDTYATGAKILAIADETWGDLSSDDDDAPTQLRFYTQSNGNTDALAGARMTINSDGNVGIGTTAPGAIAHGMTVNSQAFIGKLDIRGSAGTGGACAGTLILSTAETSVVAQDVIGAILFQAPVESGGTDSILGCAGIWCESDGGFSASGNPGELVFATGSSEAAAEKMRIDQNGKVGIGTDTPDSNLMIIASDSDSHRGLKVIDNTDNSCDTNNILVDLDYANDADVDGAYFILFQDSDGEIGEISGDGAATTYATSSDYRLKEDFKDIDNATNIINQLKLYDFAWKKNPLKRAMGVIAHEAQPIVPTAIRGQKDAMTIKKYLDENGNEQTKDVIKPQQADYSKFVPLLLKAIQELSVKVTALENA